MAIHWTSRLTSGHSPSMLFDSTGATAATGAPRLAVTSSAARANMARGLVFRGSSRRNWVGIDCMGKVGTWISSPQLQLD